MLPAGIAADPLPSSEVARLRALLPAVQTVAHLRVGRCSCDLVRPRLPDPRDDERHLRARYRRLGLPRERIVLELERHRRAAAPLDEPAEGWRAALAAFVAEHARNAGPTLYLLDFLPPADPRPAGREPLRRTVADARARPDDWLEEGRPVLIVR
jgi:hypothetical protein